MRPDERQEGDEPEARRRDLGATPSLDPSSNAYFSPSMQ